MTPMAKQPLVLMISSRCSDQIQLGGTQQSMAMLRIRLKEQLSAIEIGGHRLFEVWIHEDESDGPAETSTWETCLEAARQADVVLVLYNGNSGWQGDEGYRRDGVGICHAEAREAYHHAPSKVRSIQFTKLAEAAEGSPNARFQQWFREQKIPGAQVQNGDQALQRASDLAAAVVIDLARKGVGYAARGSGYLGAALEWSRMNFEDRRHAMRTAIQAALRTESRPGSGSEPPSIRIDGIQVGIFCDAVPAAMSTAAARELVGQPFLRDHERVTQWPKTLQGPVHLVACLRGVTESQALRQLGFPDAIVVSAPFGVYVADRGQRIQMAFLANCRDETSTQKATQEFSQWLTTSGEAVFLAQRAVVRREVCELMRKPDTQAALAGAKRKGRSRG